MPDSTGRFLKFQVLSFKFQGPRKHPKLISVLVGGLIIHWCEKGCLTLMSQTELQLGTKRNCSWSKHVCELERVSHVKILILGFLTPIVQINSKM